MENKEDITQVCIDDLVDENGNFLNGESLNGLTLPETFEPPPLQSLVRGKRKAVISASFGKALTESDILDLALREDCHTAKPTPISKLRHSHHALAKILATGTTQTEASAITGYSPSRISILMKDPTFTELVNFYTDQVDEVFIDVQQRLADLALDAVTVAQERLDEIPESVSMKELTDLLKAGADRGGFGPTSTVNNNTNTTDVRIVAQMKLDVIAEQKGNVRTINQTKGSTDRGASQGELRQ